MGFLAPLRNGDALRTGFLTIATLGAPIGPLVLSEKSVGPAVGLLHPSDDLKLFGSKHAWAGAVATTTFSTTCAMALMPHRASETSG